MHKIVTAVNSMIENASLIRNVVRSDSDELFFLYNEKFKWSMSKNSRDVYYLHYYPGSQSIEELAGYPMEMWAVTTDYVTYNTADIKTKEAQESFSELYNVLQSKLFNIDDVLDHIINTTV